MTASPLIDHNLPEGLSKTLSSSSQDRWGNPSRMSPANAARNGDKLTTMGGSDLMMFVSVIRVTKAHASTQAPWGEFGNSISWVDKRVEGELLQLEFMRLIQFFLIVCQPPTKTLLFRRTDHCIRFSTRATSTLFLASGYHSTY